MLKRRPYTDEELLKSFGSKEFIKQRERNHSRYWVCLLLLFQICRSEEAAQLALVDVQEEDGILFIRINDDPKLEQNLKNEGSRRRVPIHSSLLQLGFMAYVKGIRQGGHVRLFPKSCRSRFVLHMPVHDIDGVLLRGYNPESLEAKWETSQQ